jgi:hypothetical protein
MQKNGEFVKKLNMKVAGTLQTIEKKKSEEKQEP